jgi:hypothetical protein
MKNQIRLAVIAAMTVGGISFCVAPSLADDANMTAKGGNASMSMSSPLTLPSGITGKNLGDDKDIQEAIGDVISDTVKSKGFSDVADCFVDQDRTRLKQYKEEDGDPLTDIAGKFKAEWKSKYGKDFDFSDTQAKQTFGSVTIMTGEVANPDQLVGNWPLKQVEGVSLDADGAKGDSKEQMEATKQDITQTKKEMFGGDVNLDKSRDVAVVEVPAAMGLPPVRCSMIKEHVSGWHFDIPNNITGQQLHDNLLKCMTMITDHESDWPANESEAYGLVGHHIIEAVYGIHGMEKSAGK